MGTHEESAERCAELLAAYANHDHGYWSSPKEVPRCSGVNSIDERETKMNTFEKFLAVGSLIGYVMVAVSCGGILFYLWK